MKRKIKLVMAFVLLISMTALAVDRITLMLWRFRVQHFYERLSKAATLSPNTREPLSDALLNASPDSGWWRVPLLEVNIQGPRPASVTVDGNGGLVLFYGPPVLAWSRHIGLGAQRPMLQASDAYSYNDIYYITISTFEGRPGGKPLAHLKVELEHGLPS